MNSASLLLLAIFLGSANAEAVCIPSAGAKGSAIDEQKVIDHRGYPGLKLFAPRQGVMAMNILSGFYPAAEKDKALLRGQEECLALEASLQKRRDYLSGSFVCETEVVENPERLQIWMASAVKDAPIQNPPGDDDVVFTYVSKAKWKTVPGRQCE